MASVDPPEPAVITTRVQLNEGLKTRQALTAAADADGGSISFNVTY